MGIFESIRSAIFGHSATATAAPAAPSQPSRPASAAPASAGASPQPAPSNAAPTTTAARPAQTVDVAANLDAMAKQSGQPLQWSTSIVDLMKLLKLDSSLEHRKALAAELGYTGNTADSAAMNTWLHREVMAKLAASGGKVPDNLH